MTGPVIRLQGVRFRWRPQDPPVLDIPELEVAAGERLFLQGPSGSGKSTLLSLLGGITLPQSGSVEVLGSDLTAMSGAARDTFRADHVGFIFQMFNLVPYLSAVENVLLPCRFSARRRQAAEAAGGMATEARRLLAHMGLDEGRVEGRTVAELSVGQQQRVAAARAMIGRPEIVIADEPTSSLDTEAQEKFLGLLFDEVARGGAALLFVSHDRRLAGGFDRALALAEVNRAAEGVAA